MSQSESAEAEDDLFESAGVRGDLRGRVVRGGAVSIAAQGVKMVLRIGGLAVLARVLTPTDFGLVTMVLVALELLATLGDFGLSQAVVQKEDLSPAQLSAAFWVNLGLGLLLGVITVGAAPLVSWVYQDALLTPLTLALALRFPLIGLGAQHQALLHRRMHLGTIAIIETVAMFAGLVAALVLAWLGFGVWALVARWLVEPALMTLGWWLAASWRPGPPRRGASLRSLLSYGGNLTITRVLIYVSRNADNFLIGRLLGAAQTGLYSRAYQLLLLPQTQITYQIGRAVIPALSRLQDDAARYRQALLRATATTTLLTAPVVVVSVVHAEEMVLLLLGEQWAPAASVFRVLAIAAFLQTTTAPSDWNFMALGRTREMRRLYFIVVPVTVAGFLIGSRWGVDGVAGSYAITVSATTPLVLWMSLRGSAVSVGAMSRTIGRTAIPSLIAGGMMYGARELVWESAEIVALESIMPGLPQLTVLALGVVVGAVGIVITGFLWAPLRRDFSALAGMFAELRRPKA